VLKVVFHCSKFSTGCLGWAWPVICWLVHVYETLSYVGLLGRYIFEGLGHLVSTILINTAQYLKRINENGIKKM